MCVPICTTICSWAPRAGCNDDTRYFNNIEAGIPIQLSIRCQIILLYQTKSTCCLGRGHHIRVVVQLINSWTRMATARLIKGSKDMFVKLQWKYLKLIYVFKVSLKICQQCSVTIFTLNGGPAAVLSNGGSSHVCLARVLKKRFKAFRNNELLSCTRNPLFYLCLPGCSHQEVYPNLLVRSIPLRCQPFEI